MNKNRAWGVGRGAWGRSDFFHIFLKNFSFFLRPTPHAPRPRFVVALTLISLVIPFFYNVHPASAAEVTTSDDIRAATNFASEQGWCSVKKATGLADCKTQTTFCDANKWQSFVNDNIEFIGGGVPQIKNGLSAYFASLSGSRIIPSDFVFAYLRKDPRNKGSIPPLSESACFCQCKDGDTESACLGKDAGTPFQISPNRLFTHEECIRACQGRALASKCAGALNAIESIDSGSPEGIAAAASALSSADEQAGCFSRVECEKQEGIFEADARKICANAKGRCYAKDIDVQLNTPIGAVTTIAGFNNYIVVAYRYALSVLIVVTTVMFLWGAFRYLLGSGGIESIEKGKEVMKDSIIGMILVLSATMILRTINPMTTNLNSLKVYMINTQRFISASYCKDLAENLKLADAGAPPSTKTYEEVSKDDANFSATKDTATCGNQYFLQNASGGACMGMACPEKAESCVSCAGGDITECQGIASTRMVCSKQQFAGTIEYQDGRYPEAVYLILLCNWAQGNLSATNDSLTVIKQDVGKTAKVVGSSATDADKTGQAAYHFTFSEDAINKASEACKSKGGFRGALLGVQYNNQNSVDNFAVLSKNNCSGSTRFDGYANGTVRPDAEDLADGFQCGLHQASPHFINPSMDYWSPEELLAAAGGRASVPPCNFTLNNTTAPDRPGSTQGYCDIGQVKKEAMNAAPACASDVKNNGACDNSVNACSISGTTLCTCMMDRSPTFITGSFGAQAQKQGKWQCQ